MKSRRVLLFLLAGLLAACAGAEQSSSPSLLITPTTAAEDRLSANELLTDATRQSSTATPIVPTATPEPQIAIHVWWPDELYPLPGSTAENILLDQFTSFGQTNSAYQLDVRRKRANGLGGILPTLRTAGPVAPGALPDLTLMRYSDMVTAATEGLIYPVENWIPSGILDNVFPNAVGLGEVNGVRYGVPYAINLYHVAYRSTVLETPLLTFADVLSQEPVYLFPAGMGPGTSVNWTVLLQYLAAGGSLVDQNGEPLLDRAALLAVLEYYEQGVKDGIFDEELLNYAQFDSYWAAFENADCNLIGVDTVTYLQHKDGLTHIELAPIPTLNGTAITALDGWMWVLTTDLPDHQEAARSFLSWMMRISQQGFYTELFGILPSQQRALRLWDDTGYASFAQTLLPNAQVIPGAQRNNRAAVALQTAVTAVLQGAPAAIAADDAITQLTATE